MIFGLEPVVSWVFLLTAILAAALFFHQIWEHTADSLAGKAVLLFMPIWIALQSLLAYSGFYVQGNSFPPRLLIFGPIPMFFGIFALFLFGRHSLIDRLPLIFLTLIHTVRIPIEIVLHWLADAGAVPVAMTYNGTNIDILSGLTAPVAAYIYYRFGASSRIFLIAWNVIAFVLVLNIVITSILAFPSPMQMVGLEQPNRAVMYFPFVLLPTVIVPIVIFSHLASLRQLLRAR
jgi:hypothetical protein